MRVASGTRCVKCGKWEHKQARTIFISVVVGLVVLVILGVAWYSLGHKPTRVWVPASERAEEQSGFLRSGLRDYLTKVKIMISYVQV